MALSDKLKVNISIYDTLQRLIIINIAVFLVIRLSNAFSSLVMMPILEFKTVSNYLAIPSNFGSFLYKPWTLITYMFLHWDVLHIFFNMLWLFWMGRIFQEYLGAKKLLNTYIMGGIIGAVFFMVAFNLFPFFAASMPTAFALGASASVLAITVAAATLVPDYPIQLILFGVVKLKWIAAVTVVLDLISVNGSNAGGHIAHIGGALYGFMYIRQLKRGTDLTAWLTKFFELFSRRRKMKVAHSQKKVDEEFILNKKAKQERMDDILDKISKSGYGSLTQSEKDFLFEMSKEK